MCERVGVGGGGEVGWGVGGGGVLDEFKKFSYYFQNTVRNELK